MGSFSFIHWLVLGLVILLLFGRNRFSDMMGDVAKGIKSFKKGMADEDDVALRKLTEEKKLEVPVDRTRPIETDERREP